MTPRQHGDTETRLEGFEARLQDGFAWANAHGREIMIGDRAAFLVVGGAGRGCRRVAQPRRATPRRPSSRAIESRFTQAMGANPGEYFVPEPANAEQAAKAREAALGRARRVHRRALGLERLGARSRACKRGRARGRPRQARRRGQRLAALVGVARRRRREARRSRCACAATCSTSAARRWRPPRSTRTRAQVEAYPARGAGLDRSRRLLRARQRAGPRDRRVPRGARHGARALGAAADRAADRDPAGEARCRAARGSDPEPAAPAAPLASARL